MVTLLMESQKNPEYYQPGYHGVLFTLPEILSIIQAKGLPMMAGNECAQLWLIILKLKFGTAKLLEFTNFSSSSRQEYPISNLQTEKDQMDTEILPPRYVPDLRRDYTCLNRYRLYTAGRLAGLAGDVLI
jgi:hypothetical protein